LNPDVFTQSIVEKDNKLTNAADGWIQNLADAPLWEDFFDPDLVKTWAGEVKLCLSDGIDATGKLSWSLAGPNIVLEYNDEQEAEALLKRAANDAGLSFARVPAEAVMELADDMRAPFVSHTPVLAMLEWGPWAFGLDFASTAFAVKMRRQLERFDPTSPVLFAVCARSADAMCPDLRKVRAFDRVLSLQSATPEFAAERFLALLGPGVASDSMVASKSKVGLVLLSTFPDSDGQALAALQLRRQHRRDNRLIELNDLTELTIRGTGESGPRRRRPASELSRRRTAYHEAGHACIAVIASGGANVPDYASIVPSKDFEGIVMESLAFHDAQDDFTFEHLLLRIRILLAGRAGEELHFGTLQVSSGANSDLARATRMSYRHFAHSGFHSGMERGVNSGAFLAVLPDGETSDPFQSNRINRDVRTFLANQYAYVTRTMTEHRPFVEAVAARLLWDPIIDQAEMMQIARQHDVIK
jgi:hypothetical protein